jgi:two-component system chemotaxis response regulator CheB
MRAAGAATACQDEATSLIYGMPRAAMAIGAAEHEISLDSIPAYILQQTRAGQRPKDAKAS